MPMARTADLFLPVRPGTDSALFGAVLHELIRHDWLDHDFIDAHTVDFDEAAAAVADMTPAWAAEVCGLPAARIEQAAEWWGTSATGMLLHARGIEQQSKGIDNVLAAINLGLATGKYGKPGCAVSTITGQGNGQGGREQGHKCDQLPGNRDITNPEHRAAVAEVWGCDESEIPGKGLSAEEIIEAIHDGTIKGLLSICFNPLVSAPDSNVHEGGPRRARVLLGHRLLPVRVRPARRCRAPRITPRGGRRAPRPAARDGSSRSTPRSPHPARPGSTGRSSIDLAERLGRGQYFPFRSTKEIFEELCLASAGGTADYNGVTWERVEDEMGLFWPVPGGRPPRHAPAVRGRAGSSTPTARPASTRSRSASRPRSSTTSTRSGSPPAGS